MALSKMGMDRIGLLLIHLAMIQRLVRGKHTLPIRYWIRGMLAHLMWWAKLILVAKIRVNPI